MRLLLTAGIGSGHGTGIRTVFQPGDRDTSQATARCLCDSVRGSRLTQTGEFQHRSGLFSASAESAKPLASLDTRSQTLRWSREIGISLSFD
ncbi:MAG: hypothetical protein GY924_12250 [Planctomycetaceae bacterium]|nr:hypothetical protein [Planctomycetaceae bacterium]